MKVKTAKRFLSLALVLAMVLPMLPATALAADQRESITVPELGGFVYDQDNYNLRVVNLDKNVVTIDAGMHVGFYGNNANAPVYNPYYTSPDFWFYQDFPNRPGQYYHSSGNVTRMESNPFSIQTKKQGGKDTVPVIAMVDNASADRLLNAREGYYDFKRWANDLVARDYDANYPQKGAMVLPSQFYEGYVHDYNNYPAKPVNVLAYRDNVVPMGSGGAMFMSLVAGAVPYEPNALAVEVTGTETVPIAEKAEEADTLGNPLYNYGGPALVTVKVTNTASYPVLAEITSTNTKFVEIGGVPDPGTTRTDESGNVIQTLTDDWNPGNQQDGFQDMPMGNMFYTPQYLAAGQSVVGTISVASLPFANPPGRAFTKDVVSSLTVTVKNVTNCLGSGGIPAADKSVSVTHNTFWQGSGVANLDYVPVPYDYDPVYEVTPQSLDYKDLYDTKFVEHFVWSESEMVYTPTTFTFKGPNLDRVTRILMVAKVLDSVNSGKSSVINYTSDNITTGEDKDRYRAPRGYYSSREVVFTFTRDANYEDSKYQMVRFNWNNDGRPYTEEELKSLVAQYPDQVFTRDSAKTCFPFEYNNEEITLTLPENYRNIENYFDPKTENMYLQLLKQVKVYEGVPEQIDFYFLTEKDEYIVPTTAKLPYWMAGEKNRPACFTESRYPLLRTQNTCSLYNFRLTPKDADYETAYIERKPDATVYIDGYENTPVTKRFGSAFYLYQSDGGAYSVSNKPEGDQTPLLSFTGGNLAVMQGMSSKSAVSDRLGRAYSYFIPAGCILNKTLLVQANPYASVSGATAGVYVKRNGNSWEIWTEGCDLVAGGKPVLQDIQILLAGDKKYSTEYGVAGKTREKVPVRPFMWNGRGNTADSVPILEGGFLNGDIHGGYLYEDSIGLDTEIKDPTFLPLDIENIVGLGDVSIRAEVRQPANPDGTSLWEIKTDGKSALELGGKNYVIFEAGASLAFEADTFRETPKEDRFFNIEGEANLLDLLRVGVICNYKLVGDTYVFDKVYIRGGSDAVGLPPLVPILQISDIGGGIDGLADTLAHNNWDYIPPLTLNVDASAALTVKVIDISAEKAGIVIGLSKLGIYADSLAFSVNYGAEENDSLSVDFLRDLESYVSWDLKDTDAFDLPFPLPVFELYTQGGVELLDFLKGTASLLVVVDTAELMQAIEKTMNKNNRLNDWIAKYEQTQEFDMQGLLDAYGAGAMQLLNEILIGDQVFSVEGKAWGEIDIPSNVPIVGGHTLAAGEAGVSYYAPEITLSASGEYDLFLIKGVAGVTFTYNVTSGKHGVELMSLDGGGETGPVVTLEGVHYRDVPMVSVPVSPAAVPEPEATPEPMVTPEPETTPEPEVTPEPETTLESEVTPEPKVPPQPETTLEPEPTPSPTSTPEAQKAPKPMLLNAGADLMAAVNGFQITSQADDDVVFVEFLATKPVGINIVSATESTLKYEIASTSPDWVEVRDSDTEKTAPPDYYRYTFVFANDPPEGSSIGSIHGNSGNQDGGYTWTAAVTNPEDEAKLTACNVATIDPPEALSGASFANNTVSFTAANLKADSTYTASVSLVPAANFDNKGNPTSEGTVLADTVEVKAGENTLTLSGAYKTLVQTGSYKAVVSLDRTWETDNEEKTVRVGTSAITGEFDLTNPNAPGAMGTITPTPIGDGAVALTMPAADNNTTGYEMTALDDQGNKIMIPKLDKYGKPTSDTVDAFAAPVTYPLDMVKDGKLILAPDGSRLELGRTYQLTFTPYHQAEGSADRFYGPAQTVEVTFPTPDPATAAVTVVPGIWKNMTPTESADTRYLAQEQIITMPDTEGNMEKIGQPVETEITFTTDKDVTSWEITAVGNVFAETDASGGVTNNMTKVFRSNEGDPTAPLSKTFTLPLSVSEHLFTVETVDESGDTGVQVFRFTVDGLGVAFGIEPGAFTVATPGEASGQSFSFTATLEENGKITKVGNAPVTLTPVAGMVTWSGDPAVVPQVLAKEGDKDIAWRYVVPILVEDTATGAKATHAFGFDVFDQTAGAYFPTKLELSVNPGAKLNLGVTDAAVAVTAVTAAGPVALKSDQVTFTSSNENVLTINDSGGITPKGVGTASITATYKSEKELGDGKKFQPKVTLPVTVSAAEVKVPASLVVTEITHESVTLQLGALNTAKATLEKSTDGSSWTEVETLASGLDAAQTVTVIGLAPETDYQFRVTPEGSYYAPATAYATTYAAPTEAEKYSVTYAQDGADGGTAPVDPNLYAKGDTVQLMQSQTPLTRNGTEVLGFSTAPNGGGTKLLYADMTNGNVPSFTMGDTDMTLYPIWPAGGSTGSSGGTVKQPTFPGGTGWSGVGKALGALRDGETLAVKMNGADRLPAEVLDALAGKDVTLELDMGGGAVWVIRGTDVPQGGGLSDLKLGVDPDAKTIPVKVIDALSGAKTVLQVALAHDGPFGLTLTLRLTVGEEQAGRWANLYYYDPVKDELDFRASVRVDAQGRAELPFDHASSYAVILDSTPHAPWTNPFTDVGEGDWYYEAVRFAHQTGLFAGTSDTAFSPNVTMSRAMLWTVLARFDGQDTTGGTTWYEQGRAWAIAEGVSDGTDPEGPVTREQVAAMLYRYAEAKGLDVSGRAELSRFGDASSVSTWAAEALSWANAGGIVTGKPGGILDPQGKATRAEVAAMLQRCLEGGMK